MSTVYNVITRYRVEGLSQARQEAGAIRGVFGDLGRVLKNSVMNVRNVVAGGLFGVGLTQAANSMLSLNAGLEQANLTIATLFNVNKVYSFSDALIASKNTFKDLRSDAAAGLGELQDYLGVYQQILSPALQSGAGLDQIRELNKLLVAGGFALRGKEGPQLAGFDIQQALTSGVGQRTTPIANQALQAIGVTTEQFNAMAAPARFDKLLEAFKAFSPAIEAQSKSWEGVSSTFRDTVKEVASSATQPLFTRWTEDLIKVNEWLAHNRTEIERIESKVGGALITVWERSISLVQNWRAELQRAIPVLSTLAVIQMAGNANLLSLNNSAFNRLGRGSNQALAWGGAALQGAGSQVSGLAGKVMAPIDRIGQETIRSILAFSAPQYANSTAARPVAKVVGGGLGIADDFGAQFASGIKGGAFSGAGGLLVEAGSGLRVLVNTLNPLATIAAKVAFPITLLTAGFSAFTANTFGAATFLTDQVMGLVEEGKSTVGALIAIFDNGILRTLGAGLLAAGGGVIWALKWVLTGINAILTPIATGFQAIGIIFERGVGFIQEVIRTRSFEQATNNFWANVAQDLAGLEAKKTAGFKLNSSANSETPSPAPGVPKANAVPKSVVNIGKIEVTQKVEQNADPDRVAWAWNDMLQKINRHPRQSRAGVVPVGA